MEKRKTENYVWGGLALLLAIVLCVTLVLTNRTRQEYQEELAAVTPLPTPVASPTVSSVMVGKNENAAQQPTAEAFTQAPVYMPVTASVFTQTPAVPSKPTSTPGLLVNGSSGEAVSALQTRLSELGYYAGAVDGQYGSKTQQAVEAFQKQHGLDADGKAGVKTQALLYSDQAQQVRATATPRVYNVLEGEIPLLVNASHTLPDDFVPFDLVSVKDVAGNVFDSYADNGTQGVREAVEALTRMIQAAKADGVTPWKLREGYRTIKQQQRIFNNKVQSFVNEGFSHANAVSATRQTVADPGASEHHTGLAFDLNVEGQYFGDTAQYAWLVKHCWEYGFIMRYTDEKEEITGILGEEWHVRYVGDEHSTKIRDMDMCLEEYVEWLETR